MSPPRSEGAVRGLSRPAAVAIVAGVLGASALLGRRNAPDRSHGAIRRWYKRLDKPSYTPPDAAFGAVWPTLEAGLAVGGYRLLRQPAGTRRNLAVGLWLLNTGMIGGWTELFFRKHALGASTAASGAMVVGGAGYAVAARKVDPVAAILALPFVAWVAFATLLAERVWQHNPDAGDAVASRP
ncbi:TspO/MBR family protein [uncultured Sphingomonas sp.]|uniref:TspO/MBR family protein n=1 Tax=uncultured Sphingomonas sp. TaxID=158754 RepID=UPI0025E243FD|nr:TspO/MBR family protein [uncultured Sphingomonas sp.]